MLTTSFGLSMNFAKAPKTAAIYNLGGGRASNVSMLEAIDKC